MKSNGSKVVTITPTAAQGMFARNRSNRRIRKSQVASLARQMQENRWQLNGETIKFDAEGNLLDGQHRLLACMEADVSFETYVVEGLERSVYESIDQQSRRTAEDLLSQEGYSNPKLLASAAGQIFRWDVTEAKTIRATPKDVLEIVTGNDQLIRTVEVVESIHRSGPRLVPKRILAYVHYRLSLLDEDEADLFIHDLVSGDNLATIDPVYHLRQRFITIALGKTRMLERDVMALMFKTWNYRRAGKATTGQGLRFAKRGRTKERFPEPR